MRQIKLPEWTRDLPGHANLTSRDVINIFGYAPSTWRGWSNFVKQGLLPPPDSWVDRLNRGSLQKALWQLNTLRRIESEQAEHKENK